jgi:phytol kinase
MTNVELARVVAVLAVVVVVFLLLQVLRRFVAITPEQVRKLAHLGMGALAISFAWVFSSKIAVFLVCGLAVLLMLAIRYYSPLKRKMGGVLGDVGRKSHGEIYFPLSIALLFYLARGSKLMYVIPLLVLTFADSMAALLGEEYGKHGYAGIGGSKSAEGSVSFFTVTFFSVHIPLLLFTQLGRPETLLIAIDIALVVTLLEAVAWHGLDNLFIPLGVFILLHIYMTLPMWKLVLRLIVAAGLLIFIRFYRSRTTLQASALLAATLTLYVSWGLGGWRWLIAPATVFATYTLFYPDRLSPENRVHNVYAVLSVASAGLIWVFLAQSKWGPVLLYPYTLGYAIQLAILGWTLRVFRTPEQTAWKAGLPIITVSCVLIFLPWIAVERFSRSALLESVLGWVLCGAAFALFCSIERRQNGLFSVSGIRWARQAAIVFVATLAGAGMMRLL